MPRIFNLSGMVKEAMENPYPRVGKEICPATVTRVWEAVSDYINDQFSHGRGVTIKGLLRITYYLQKIQVGQKEVLVNRVPLLMLSEDVVKKYHISTKGLSKIAGVPENPVNLSYIACKTGLPTCTVDACLQEVIQAFHRACVRDHNIEFHLVGIGRLIIENRFVRSSFCRNFLHRYELEQPRIKDGVCAI